MGYKMRLKRWLKNRRNPNYEEVLAEERNKRASACQKEVSEVLAKHNCTIYADMVISQQNILPRVKVMALENE